MKIRCVTIGKHITAQGILLELLPDGRAIVDTGMGPVAGTLVGA